MTAVIMLDLARVHPVFDGKWHHVELSRLPQPGEPITTLCGRTEAVVYVASGQGAQGSYVVQTCWSCDLVYRRQKNMPVSNDHPALGLDMTTPLRPVPSPRKRKAPPKTTRSTNRKPPVGTSAESPSSLPAGDDAG